MVKFKAKNTDKLAPNSTPTGVPYAYRGSFQQWGEYCVGYKCILADKTSQYDQRYEYIPGTWQHAKQGIWFRPSLTALLPYWKGAGRLVRLLVKPTDMTTGQDHARDVFIQAMTPPLFVWPTKDIMWPLFFDPDLGEPLDGPFAEVLDIMASWEGKAAVQHGNYMVPLVLPYMQTVTQPSQRVPSVMGDPLGGIRSSPVQWSSIYDPLTAASFFIRGVHTAHGFITIRLRVADNISGPGMQATAWVLSDAYKDTEIGVGSSLTGAAGIDSIFDTVKTNWENSAHEPK